MTGPIPGELGSLANLELLSLHGNELTGPIPGELGSLANLLELLLNDNALTGPIPGELGSLANLERLSLRDNALTGPIPGELGSLANLERLSLRDNALTGPIPGELGSLANLERLFLRGNELTGPIPGELGSLVKLQFLDLSYNELTGTLPHDLTRLSELEILDITSTGVCAPADAAFQAWLATIDFRGATCGTNRVPRSTGSVPAQTLTVGGGRRRVVVTRYFTDPDGDALTYTARSSRSGVVTTGVSGGAVTLTPVSAGTATVTVTARDPGGLSATQSIAVTVERGANRAPRSTGSVPAQTLTEAHGQGFVVVARYFTDPDGDALTYTARSSRSGVVTTGVSGGAVTLTPVSAGTATVTVTARDPGGLSARQSIAVTVERGANRVPRSTGSVPAQTLTVGGGSASVVVTRYFTDPDGDALTYTARSSRSGVVTTGVSGGAVTLTPVSAGTASVTITARDPGGLSATQSISVRVQAAGGVNGFTDDPLGVCAAGNHDHHMLCKFRRLNAIYCARSDPKRFYGADS